jgi:alkaline phosphatase D
VIRRAGAICLLIIATLSAGASAAGIHRAASAPRLTLGGVVVGDVTASRAVLWARPSERTTLRVRLTGGSHGRVAPVAATAKRDLTVQVVLRGLRPATTYRYRVRLAGPRGSETRGSFRTAPPAKTPAPVRLAFGGDLAGQNVCRDVREGFPIANTIHAWKPDAFIGLGDMVYADDSCLAKGRYGNAQIPTGFGPATDLGGYLAHWRYNRSDRALEQLLASTNYVGVWDDHEIKNDSGPLTSGPLLGLGLQAFLDYTPIAIPGDSPHRIYRERRYGRNLDVFVLDTRQYRDANFAADDPRAPKTMLGREQLTWLETKLAASDAIWKVVVSSVPMSIPTGFPPTNGRDGWANFDQRTGYEHELVGLLRSLEQHRVRNLFFITTDVHFGEGFRYTPFADDPAFHVYELVTGPMNSGIFPTTSFDTTLNPERLFLYAPPSANAVTSWEQAKRWFNFGALAIARNGTLTARIVNTAGDAVETLRLKPTKSPP